MDAGEGQARRYGGPTQHRGLQPADYRSIIHLPRWRSTASGSLYPLPVGLDADGLPIGLRIVGWRFADEIVLSASGAFECERLWYDTYERTTHMSARRSGPSPTRQEDRRHVVTKFVIEV
jgi:hypothetical protein